MPRITTLQRLRELIPPPSPLVDKKIRPSLDSQAIAFTRRSPFLLLATVGNAGLDLSPKGGEPGFVAVPNEKTLLIPEHQGNQLAFGLINLLTDDRIGVMLVRPGTDELLRVRGSAELLDDDVLCKRMSARGRPAILVVKVTIHQAFFHCVRSIKRARLWDPLSWDEPSRISFGKIYAEAAGQPELRSMIDERQAGFAMDL